MMCYIWTANTWEKSVIIHYVRIILSIDPELRWVEFCQPSDIAILNYSFICICVGLHTKSISFIIFQLDCEWDHQCILEKKYPNEAFHIEPWYSCEITVIKMLTASSPLPLVFSWGFHTDSVQYASAVASLTLVIWLQNPSKYLPKMQNKMNW